MNVAIWQPIRKAYVKHLSQQGRVADSEAIAIYIDDIFLATPTVEDHLFLLKELFALLAKC